MKVVKSLTPGLENEFCELRSDAFSCCLQDVAERLLEQKQIVPTEEEKIINSIWELIERQVRDAVRELNRKGYCTMDSGFWGELGKYQKQFIRGRFDVDEATVNLLASEDVRIEKEEIWTIIWFYAKNPDLDEIKQTWDEIVDLIPDLGHGAESLEEIFHFDEDRILQKLFELGKITEKDYRTFKKDKNRVLEKPRRGR